MTYNYDYFKTKLYSLWNYILIHVYPQNQAQNVAQPQSGDMQSGYTQNGDI